MRNGRSGQIKSKGSPASEENMSPSPMDLSLIFSDNPVITV